MESDDDTVKVQPVGRRTRSGRTSIPSAKAAATSRSPIQPKSTGRKTRKKMVLVEVEVSDEEEGESLKTLSEHAKADNSVSTELEENVPSPNKVIECEINDTTDINEVTDVIDLNKENVVLDVSNTTETHLIETNILNDDNIVNEENIFSLNDIANEQNITEENVINEESVIHELSDEDNIVNQDILGMKSNIESHIIEETMTNQDVIQDDCIIVTENVDLFSGMDSVSNGLNPIDSDKSIEKIDTFPPLPPEDENVQNGINETHSPENRLMDSMNPENDSMEISQGNVEAENKMEVSLDEDVIMEEITNEKILSDEDDEVKNNESSDVTSKLQPADPDAENISEDELPSIQVAKVPETEEVSDEELPGPKRAELPADTEVVSEDELPAVKKEGTKRKLAEGDYDPGSPTSENEVSSKKPFLDPDIEKEKEKPEKPKKLPELDKYWKAVNDDPTDFTGWTYLLQYVDQENDMEAAREAYDAFLSHYPYCYGYWRKYADYEKRKGNKKKCEEVFERGLKAIPLSVDLWIHYLTYVRTTKPEDEEFVRSQFERALIACGLEFRSDRLWDSYIKWETDGKRFQHATAIYDRLLATPTQGYTTHFDNFQEHVSSNPPNKIVEVDEFLALRKEVKHMLKHDVTTEPVDDPNVPPGEDSEEVSTDEETKAIRERIISIRRKIHKNTVTAVTSRWNFEEGIKRPYFHVKPLERCQLKNWQEYLDYEIEHGDKTRIIVLFERCLIACALYEEFWLRFVHYLEGLKDPDLHPKIKDVYERACTIHHIKKPNLHLQWAMFEESIKNYTKAAEILVNLEKSVPNLLQVAYRRINLERRREDYEKCSQLFEHYINNSKNKVISTNLAIKYARFCLKIMSNVEKAFEVLNTALTKDPNNPRLYLQLIDLTMQKDGVCEKEVSGYIDAFLEKENIDVEQKILFAQRKLEFLDDFGSDIQSVQKAYEEYQKLIKIGKDNKKKDVVKGESAGKKDKNPPLPSSQANSYSNYANYGNSSGTPYQYSGSQQGQYNYSQYGQSDQYQYGNWQYPQGNYSGYNQWSGYSGGYSY